MIEKRRTCADDGQVGGAMLIDLSKAFNCINHDFLIAKLTAYRFSLESILKFDLKF